MPWPHLRTCSSDWSAARLYVSDCESSPGDSNVQTELSVTDLCSLLSQSLQTEVEFVHEWVHVCIHAHIRVYVCVCV